MTLLWYVFCDSYEHHNLTKTSTGFHYSLYGLDLWGVLFVFRIFRLSVPNNVWFQPRRVYSPLPLRHRSLVGCRAGIYGLLLLHRRATGKSGRIRSSRRETGAWFSSHIPRTCWTVFIRYVHILIFLTASFLHSSAWNKGYVLTDLTAWTAKPSIHWIVPTIGAFLTMGGSYIIIQALFLYLPFTYPQYAASLFAANDFARSSFAAGCIVFSGPMFRNLGVAKGCTLLAGLTVGCTGCLYILYFFGASLRKRSRFAVK